MREIRGDRLEQSRIRLERDIDNNIPSLPSMSSDNIDDDDLDVSSVDFARHNSHPTSFHSFEHLSHLDSDFYSRHGDDDSIALDPDLGHTMSTAAHHASALTLSAGLRGRGNCHHATGRTSPSGAEFDPERPLQAMLDSRVADGISLFDATARSKSKSSKSLKQDQTRSVPTYDPVVVDSTAELDRLLQTGHQCPRMSRSGFSHPYISRSHSQPDPSASDSSHSSPRLSQALSHQFSPKRPRSAPVSAQNLHPPLRPDYPTPNRTEHTYRSIPSKPQPGPSNLSPARHHRHIVHEPKSSDSQFSKVTRSIARGIDAQSRLLSRDREGGDENGETPRSRRRGIFPSTPAPGSAKRSPFANIVNKDLDEVKPRKHSHLHTSARIHLPDVTGLTSAVQSPSKGGDGYVSADAAHPSLAVDLLPALDALQNRLQILERENGVCRRRVKELEFELDECKAEVVKERTRVREREREFDQETLLARERERERNVRGRMRGEEGRYREVVEEKKALEELITTLRTHLARLTSELSSHKSLIAGLRADTYAAGEAHAEVETLRAEVERLAGEVERLKEVVEEGLRERRRTRNASGHMSIIEKDETTGPAELGIDLTYVTVPVSRIQELPERGEPLTVEDLEPEHEQEQELEQESAYKPEATPAPEPASYHSRRYIQASELARVESEMHERRSERSLSAGSRSSVSAGSRVNDSGNGSSVHEAEHDPSVQEQNRDQGPSPVSSVRRPTVQPSLSDRATNGQRNVSPPKQPAPSTPFPQIRGSRMERLFFSAPEHNVRTCSVCHRRKREKEHRAYQGDDKGSEEAEKDEELLKTYLRNKAKRIPGKQKYGDLDDKYDPDDDRLPPQTVLARVVRELEDDFMHYKAIYLELAEQYGVIDAASNVAKRNVLADHLREVIDTLEQKGDQIASLYDLLNFRDKPLPGSAPAPRPKYTAFV